ncbi:uncharacterized protein LOC125023689 isoform X2 [Mugil cephalus]|uniref:uncharacterized protein LOC125023689 isoform X2 n=1 Tax=Mugil cephalus TaxID=48193 RepID=UPI001FB8250F|nr:uncharacterized protein LOC125023689 isoform X2 [Mugil cephalus]
MPSFVFLDNVERYIRRRTFPLSSSKSSKSVIRAASKHFVYKDGALFRSFRGRLLRVVRSDEEMREILTRYHDNNNHAGRVRAVKEIMLMYYWVGVTEVVKNWIRACTVCQTRSLDAPPDPPVRFCLVYGCDASSYVHPELSFHRFPKESERRSRWLTAAQRDEGSLRINSYVCSRHFEPSCFTLSEDGQRTLSPDAAPTIRPGLEGPVPPGEDVFRSDPAFDPSLAPVHLQEHQYCLPAPDPDHEEDQKTRSIIEPKFTTYNNIVRFLSRRMVPTQSKKSRCALKRMAKRFGLVDGALMYTRVSPPLRVPLSSNEVTFILKKFHDDQGHCGQGLCQRAISKQYYWASMTRDVSRWISTCNTCINRTKRKMLRCSIYNCTNCSGPVERGLGLTFHKFPFQYPSLLAQWLKAVGRSHYHPRLWSSVCSTHFTDDCFDRSGEKVVLRPDAVPTLMVHSDSAAFFAKYDAVELYLSRRTYPPGLSYVEKNTFRTFCKKFSIKDGQLHLGTGDRVRLVLRNRQQVETALKDYHNELNHLNVTKSLRLLSDRFFWKTMRCDVVQWIESCSQCSSKLRKKPETRSEAGGPETLRTPGLDSDSMKDNNNTGDEYEDEEAGGDTEGQSTGTPEDTEINPASPVYPPVLSTPSFSVSSSVLEAQRDQVQVEPQEQEVRTPHFIQPETWSETLEDSEAKGGGGLDPVVAPSSKPWPVFTIASSTTAQTQGRPPETDSSSQTQGTSLQARTVVQLCTEARVQIRAALDGAEAQWAQIQEGMVVFVCFFHGASEDVTCEMGESSDRPSSSVFERFNGLPLVSSSARTLMTTKFFRRDTGHAVSLLELPGSVLFIHQDSLLGEPLAHRSRRYRGGCEPWWGVQLFSSLASACRELMLASAKCRKAGVRVEQGVYGRKQEMVLKSSEPLTQLLHF